MLRCVPGVVAAGVTVVVLVTAIAKGSVAGHTAGKENTAIARGTVIVTGTGTTSRRLTVTVSVSLYT